MPLIPVQTRLAAPAPTVAQAFLPVGSESSAPRVSVPSAPLTPSLPHTLTPSVSLQIDSLVLHGFPAAEARRVGAAFEKELARLLSESPLSPSLPPAPRDSLTPSSTPDAAVGHWTLDLGHSGAVGAGAARALHARLRA